ncbi:MAG: hypothetical protein WB677_16965, partial [Xanthobacteraceae bacterium]
MNVGLLGGFWSVPLQRHKLIPRRFGLGSALTQHSAEIVLAGIDSATGKKCAGGLGGEVLLCGQFRFGDPSGSPQLTYMSARLPPTESGRQMSLEIKEIIAEREIERYQL